MYANLKEHLEKHNEWLLHGLAILIGLSYALVMFFIAYNIGEQPKPDQRRAHVIALVKEHLREGAVAAILARLVILFFFEWPAVKRLLLQITDQSEQSFQKSVGASLVPSVFREGSIEEGADSRTMPRLGYLAFVHYRRSGDDPPSYCLPSASVMDYRTLTRRLSQLSEKSIWTTVQFSPKSWLDVWFAKNPDAYRQILSEPQAARTRFQHFDYIRTWELLSTTVGVRIRRVVILSDTEWRKLLDFNHEQEFNAFCKINGEIIELLFCRLRDVEANFPELAALLKRGELSVFDNRLMMEAYCLTGYDARYQLKVVHPGAELHVDAFFGDHCTFMLKTENVLNEIAKTKPRSTPTGQQPDN